MFYRAPFEFGFLGCKHRMRQSLGTEQGPATLVCRPSGFSLQCPGTPLSFPRCSSLRAGLPSRGLSEGTLAGLLLS